MNELELLPTPSATVLEQTIPRAVKLLYAVGTRAPIRRQMRELGYDTEEHRLGWALVHRASGFDPGQAQDQDSIADELVRKATRTLDANDEVWFRRVKAALAYTFPRVHAELTQGIGPSTGPTAVAGMKALVERLDALEASAAAGSPERAALDRLEKRKLGSAWRAEVRALVEQAEILHDLAEEAPVEDDADGGEDEASELDALSQQDALKRLYYWHREWAEAARTVIKRRDQLISMGLGQRQTSSVAEDDGDAELDSDAGETPPEAPPTP